MRCVSPRRFVALLVAVGALAACTDGGSPASVPGTPTVSAAPTSVAPSASASPSAAPATTSPALARFYDQKLDWRECEGGFECATLKVPVDYAAPDARDAIALSVIRNPADGKRRGSLVVNPGGPGGSGYGYALRSNSVLPQSVRDRYDVVGFDPRGVQRSRPSIDCLSDAQLDAFIAAETTEDNAATQLRYAKRFANGCANRSPELVGQVGTRDAARDLDLLRAALGEKKLDYLGKSYGTLLGITYAETFPDRAGRMVLDGVLDPALDAETLLRGQAAGFERAYRAFLRSCVSDGCPLGSTEDRAYAGTRAFLDRIDDEPLGADGGRQLTRSLAELAILGSLYEDRSQWASLERALRSALGGSPYAMLALADSAVDRQPGGRYPDNSNEAQYAVTCLDRAYPATVTQTAERARRLAQRYPVFGEYIAWGDLPCTEWRAGPTRQAHRVAADGIPPLLLVGTTRDPATPYGWATSLRGQLPSSRLVTWKGDGHTGYFRGSGCVDDVVDAYLLDGVVPATDPTCTGR